MTKVLAIWLDGFSFELADRFVAEGELPNLAALGRTAARWDLDDHGARLTGLAGEHLSSGLDPERARRWAAVDFDPTTYDVHQVPRSVETVFRHVPLRTVVFDTTYFDLSRGSGIRGITGWGTHDPGGAAEADPPSLRREVHRRFGDYPAAPFIYTTPWSSPDRCREAGVSLGQAVDTRADIATWLVTERIPDWDLAIIGVSEAHSAVEALWHGVDPDHILHAHPSGEAAGSALRHVYRRIDALIGSMSAAVPDAMLTVFSLHGMGRNGSDVASMAAFGDLLAAAAGVWTPPTDPFGTGIDRPVILPDSTAWSSAVRSAMHSTDAASDRGPTIRSRAIRHLEPLRPLASRVRRTWRSRRSGHAATHDLSWMPSTIHRAHWPTMPVFAIPSFYDGRARVNLIGREAHGVVPLEGYHEVLDDTEALLRACHDPVTGQPVVDHIDRPLTDPLAATASQSDLVVHWKDTVHGFAHPELGTIGPYPLRRTGGHSGGLGALLVRHHGIAGGHRGIRSSFDVVPTLIDLAGGGEVEVSGTPIAELQQVGRPI